MRTALYSFHQKLGAKLIDFHGWEMPIQYTSILEEHRAVRQKVGIFDVSHMGRIEIQGVDAEKFLDEMVTNVIAGKKDQQAIYAVLCNEKGMSLDDVIVLRHSSSTCSVIANASNRDKVFGHLTQYAHNYAVSIKAAYLREGILAIQGPASIAVASQLLPPTISQLAPMTCWQGEGIIISRTGYTGEQGVEVFAETAQIVELWERFLALQAQPVGLGARDTLRLEKGYALYGHELSESIAPTESVSRWAVKLQKPYFLGKEALIRLENSTNRRHQYGVLLKDAPPARAQMSIWQKEEEIGIFTSGTFSPTLKQSIAIAMSKKTLSLGESIAVQVRNHFYSGNVVQLPFI